MLASKAEKATWKPLQLALHTKIDLPPSSHPLPQCPRPPQPSAISAEICRSFSSAPGSVPSIFPSMDLGIETSGQNSYNTNLSVIKTDYLASQI